MTVPSTAIKREGRAFTPDGALYVTPATGAPVLLAQSYAPVSAPSDTNENVLATITVPAGALGANTAVRLMLLWTLTNNANGKTIRVRMSGSSGTQFSSIPVASLANTVVHVLIANRAATNSQVSVTEYLNAGGTAGSLTPTTGSVDVSGAVTIVVTAQKSTAGDTMTLEGYTAEALTP